MRPKNRDLYDWNKVYEMVDDHLREGVDSVFSTMMGKLMIDHGDVDPFTVYTLDNTRAALVSVITQALKEMTEGRE